MWSPAPHATTPLACSSTRSRPRLETWPDLWKAPTRLSVSRSSTREFARASRAVDQTPAGLRHSGRRVAGQAGRKVGSGRVNRQGWRAPLRVPSRWPSARPWASKSRQSTQGLIRARSRGPVSNRIEITFDETVHATTYSPAFSSLVRGRSPPAERSGCPFGVTSDVLANVDRRGRPPSRRRRQRSGQQRPARRCKIEICTQCRSESLHSCTLLACPRRREAHATRPGRTTRPRRTISRGHGCAGSGHRGPLHKLARPAPVTRSSRPSADSRATPQPKAGKGVAGKGGGEDPARGASCSAATLGQYSSRTSRPETATKGQGGCSVQVPLLR